MTPIPTSDRSTARQGQGRRARTRFPACRRTLTLLHQRAERAITEGELTAGTRPDAVVQYVLGQFAALSAVSRASPGRPELEQLVGFMVAGLPWDTSR